jgi:hypothetical protein
MEGMMSDAEPMACFQSSRTDLKCRACGECSIVVHFPIRYVGSYCEKCCPACRLKAAVVALAEWREIHPYKSAAKE